MSKKALLCLSTFLLFSCGVTPAGSLTSTTSAFSTSGSLTQSQTTVYDFYCVNDFHGSIVEQENGSRYEAGIAKYFGKLKALKAQDPEHTFLFSAGDMFQGSMESNDNYGHLVIDAMNDARFDAMVVGNHEFDYGQAVLLDNASRMEFPLLGGNVKNYFTGAQWNEAIVPSVTFERGGNKIGVVGMIGEGQTASITSTYVSDIDFVDHSYLAKQEAKRLREEGCSIVVYLIHDEESSVTYAANKEYFDGVFTAHTHMREKDLVNGVPFVQSYCNGSAYSHFQITLKDGASTCTGYGVTAMSRSATSDPDIAKIRDSYIKTPEFSAKAGEFAGTIYGTLGSKEGVANLICKAIYERYKEDFPDLDLAMCNGQRASLYGEVTYRDVYKATPFMNNVVIAKVKGKDILNEAAYNLVYSPTKNYQEEEEYTIACIDYLMYHQNTRKQYNYFYCLNGELDSRILFEEETYPFDLAFEYIRDDLGGSVNASDFSSDKPYFHI